MKNLFVLFFSCFTICIFSHDVNKAYFKIYQNTNEVIVEAEFPWTLRKAVFKEFPALENTKNQKSIDEALFNYIKKYLQILDADGNILSLKSVTYFVKKDAHSHQNDYKIVFKGNDFFTVTNTLLFNNSKKQQNYHTVTINHQEFDFTTHRNHRSFTKKSTPANSNLVWICSSILIAFMVVIIYKKRTV